MATAVAFEAINSNRSCSGATGGISLFEHLDHHLLIEKTS
jgi:hypothetical protein